MTNLVDDGVEYFDQNENVGVGEYDDQIDSYDALEFHDQNAYGDAVDADGDNSDTCPDLLNLI